MLLKTFGISAATVALAIFGYAAQAQAPKKDEPKAAAKKPAPPPACSKLKEADCKARTDCVFTAAVVDEKTKKVKTKASCKNAPKPKADPKKK